MHKELVFLSAQPNDLHFIWQLDIQLHNFRKWGILAKHDYHITVWNNPQRAGGHMFAREWNILQQKYANTGAKFFFYNEKGTELNDSIKTFGYASLVRPWVLYRHFKEHPDLKDKAVFYTDQDVLFTHYPQYLSKFKDDDINYLSDTRGYISASYFDSKIKDVKPEVIEQYKMIDPLQLCMDNLGLSREEADKNELNSGGAQYLLKNIDAQFWQNVFIQCINIKNTLKNINRKFFESENKGFQSWCADMWAVLWLLWQKGAKTRCPPEMEFAWATDVMEKLDRVNIYHNAGATPDSIKHGDKFHHLFYKGRKEYINNERTPFEDDHLNVSESYCSAFYVNEMEEVKYGVNEHYISDLDIYKDL